MLRQWCTNVMRSKVEPMKEVARMIPMHGKDVLRQIDADGRNLHNCRRLLEAIATLEGRRTVSLVR
jgi:hypothetical protein